MSKPQLATPEELFHYQLRAALKMEEHSLAALEELESAAKDKSVKKLFSHHADETKEQILHLHDAFALLREKAATSPSPATTGIKKQAASLLEKVGTSLRDQVALMSALGNEHFEISVYQGLILQAGSLGSDESVVLFETNLSQEQHTSEELHAKLQEMLT